MDLGTKKFVMVSNRGPNFVSNNILHRGMGGTKEIYAHLVDNFCKGWVCLASGELESKNVSSEYGDILKVIFVQKEKYDNYYYKYVSEFLYPSLLGYGNRAIKTHSTTDFNEISKKIVSVVKENFGKTDVMICDYHLYKIPQLIDWKCHKIFFWFIPILTSEYYFPQFKEIVWSLSRCDEIYFFNETWCTNYKKAFKYYYPGEVLKTRIRSVMMGPDDQYSKSKNIKKSTYVNTLKSEFGIVDAFQKKFILSVSRMDFVKNIPLTIKGFERYLKDNPKDINSNLILIAPHHRKNSIVYVEEENLIQSLVMSSPYKDRIYLTHEYFSADQLRILFKFVDIFVCASTFDAVPLTPLEYVLANGGNGAVLLSDSIGAHLLTYPNCYEFVHEDAKSLAIALEQIINDGSFLKKQRILAIKSIILEESLQKSMIKIKGFLTRQ